MRTLFAEVPKSIPASGPGTLKRLSYTEIKVGEENAFRLESRERREARADRPDGSGTPGRTARGPVTSRDGPSV